MSPSDDPGAPAASDLSSFDAATAWTRVDERRFVGDVSPAWMQGRTAFGGLSAAVAIRGLASIVDAERTPRSAQVAFVGPMGVGPAELRVEVLRAGKAVTFVRGEVWQADRLCTTVIATFAADRAVELAVTPAPRPPRPAPDDVLEWPFLPGLSPEFTRGVAFRGTDGQPPFTGAADGLLGGWCRFRAPAGPPVVLAVGLLDVWPAPVLPMMRAPAPASSVTWTLGFATIPAAAAPDAWWFYRAETLAAAHGYAHMRGSLWAPDGQLCAVSEQLVATF